MLLIAVQWILVAMILLLIGEVSWIAFMQMRIAANNNKLELYDKRFRVFEAAATYIHHL